MVANVNNPTPIFPDYPREQPTVDKEGKFTYLWDLALGQLFQTLQTNFRNEGVKLPPLTTVQADQVKALYTPLIGNPLPPGTPDISGQTMYNSTILAPQIFIISYDGATPPNIADARWWTFTIT
jgi:hypothetical protein